MSVFRRDPTRRQVLRSASVASAAVAASGLLAACSGTSKANKATPVNNAPTITLNFSPNWQGASWNKTAQTLNQQFIDESSFTTSHPGVHVNVNAPNQGGATAQIVATIAGTGFNDVFQDCCGDLAVWEDSGFLAPLDSYLRQDNINTDIWPQGHLSVLTYDGQIKALPAYDGPVVVFYRQDILDDMGLDYPDPTWTSTEAQAIWQASSKVLTGNKQQYGIALFDTGYDEMLNWWLKGWGADMMNADGTQCLADSAQGTACLQFLADLFRQKISTGRGDVSQLVSGTAVFKQSGGWELLPAATELGTKFKWDILPNPVWPGGKSTFNNIDFYGLNAQSKNIDLAWELLNWVCAGTDYQRFQMQTTLVQPCLNSLWDEWQTIVTGQAPPLQGKQLQWFGDAEKNGYAYPQRFYKYSATQANTVIVDWIGQIETGKIDAAGGLRQMAAQINALEAAGTTNQKAAAQVAQTFPVNGAAIAKVATGL